MRVFLYIMWLTGGVLYSSICFAQYAWDGGIVLGGANYLGEMDRKNGQQPPYMIQNTNWVYTQPAAGIFIRYRMHTLLSASAGITFFGISGNDSLSSDPYWRGRNLHFRNQVTELSTRLEINFWNAYDLTNRGITRVDFRAYILGGAGMIYHKPQAFDRLKYYDLQDFRTEGVSYSSYQPVFPVGFGFYYTVRHKNRYGFEFGYRFTLTDYLDDASTVYRDSSEFQDPASWVFFNRSAAVSKKSWFPGLAQYDAGAPRGNPKYNDGYFFFTFSYSYVARGRNNFYRSQYTFLTGQKKYARKIRAKF